MRTSLCGITPIERFTGRALLHVFVHCHVSFLPVGSLGERDEGSRRLRTPLSRAKQTVYEELGPAWMLAGMKFAQEYGNARV